MTATRDPMRPPTPILIFDIETAPDIPLLADIYEPNLDSLAPLGPLWNDLRVVEQIQAEKPKFFPPPLFHRVISISAVFVHPESYLIMDGFRKTIRDPQNEADLNRAEKDLLQDFWTFSGKYRDYTRSWYDHIQSDYRLSEYQKNKIKPVPVVFCGYNISGFDLPVIEQRSIRHLMSCPIQEYVSEEGPGSYRYKYGSDRIYDLLDYISNYQSNCRIKLNAISRSLGLGGKMEGMDGSLVADEFYRKKNFQQIEEYCAVDVLITYGVFLAIQKFRGILSESHFQECAREFHQFLVKEGRPEVYRELAEKSSEFFSAANQRSVKACSESDGGSV